MKVMKLFISGYGKMGKMIEQIILSRNIEYAGWTEAVTETDPALAKECVCIDFTTPAAFRANYRFLAENFKAVVVGTTGWADIHDEVVGVHNCRRTSNKRHSRFSYCIS